MLYQTLIHPTRILRLALFMFSWLLFFTAPAAADAPASTTAIPTRLIIPAITLDSHIVAVAQKDVTVNGQPYKQWQTDDKFVGWHNLSATPGQAGNMVLNGHSNVYAKVFQNLDKLQVGDEIVTFVGDQPYRYLVTEKILVREKGASLEERIENAKLIMPTPDERLTLITCSQPGATHRLLVIARPVIP
ncbi:MAG: sortase [Anaerolineae bacterium]